MFCLDPGFLPLRGRVIPGRASVGLTSGVSIHQGRKSYAAYYHFQNTITGYICQAPQLLTMGRLVWEPVKTSPQEANVHDF